MTFWIQKLRVRVEGRHTILIIWSCQDTWMTPKANIQMCPKSSRQILHQKWRLVHCRSPCSLPSWHWVPREMWGWKAEHQAGWDRISIRNDARWLYGRRTGTICRYSSSIGLVISDKTPWVASWCYSQAGRNKAQCWPFPGLSSMSRSFSRNWIAYSIRERYKLHLEKI